jgi:predicted RNA-binding Zn ribbon-like protein
MDAPGEDRSPALALANSWRTTPRETIDELTTIANLHSWLERHEIVALPGAIGREQLDQLRELRDSIRELLAACVAERAPQQTAISIVNTAARAEPTSSQLKWDDSTAPEAERTGDSPGSFASVLSTIASDAIDLVTGPHHTQIRACQAPGCTRYLLVDHPRRRWCSTRCSDRVRAANYYQRTRTASATPATDKQPV